MNRILPLKAIALLFISSWCYAAENISHNPLLVAVIMVKNEESVIEKTLEPFVKDGINSFLVFDTGSTDNTIQVTRDFFEKHDVTHGYIEEEPFIDFATSRNHALNKAHEKFPNAGFIVMFDAEWYINDAAGLVKFCQDCLNNGIYQNAHHIRILNQYNDFYGPRLIRCNTGTYFEGVVHEILYCPTTAKVPENIYFEYSPSKQGCEKSAQRFIRDRKLLYKNYIDNPTDTRNLFYLARTCEDLGNLEEAYTLYKERIKLVGWPEEDFMAVYRLAQTIVKLSHTNEKYPWHEALHYYLEAHTMRPSRAEPLISIAYYYVGKNEMEKAFIFARRAAEIPYPKNDHLFVQKYAYDYVRHELLARSVWYIEKFNNEYKLGKKAAKKAYKEHPEYKHAHHNMECYNQYT